MRTIIMKCFIDLTEKNCSYKHTVRVKLIMMKSYDDTSELGECRKIILATKKHCDYV